MFSLFRCASTLFVCLVMTSWCFNVNAGTAELVKDINLSDDTSRPKNFFLHNGLMYFLADDEINDTEIWVTDGTVNGTRLLKDINPGNGDVDDEGEVNFIAVGSTVFFTADNGFNGSELWKTNGTEQGTVLVKDINQNVDDDGSPNGASILEFATAGSTLFFSARDGVNDRGLWQSDGTEVGTVMIQNSTNDLSDPSDITALDSSTILFSAVSTIGGRELWKYEIGQTNAVSVIDIIPFSEGGNPEGLTLFGDDIYFSASDGSSSEVSDNESGRELWRSDGTTVGTVMVKDINSAPGASSFPRNFIVFDGALYFSAEEPTAGNEVWRTDGTEMGTELVHDINSNDSGADSSDPNTFVSMGGELFFLANDGSNDRQLWKSNGAQMNPMATMLTDSGDFEQIVSDLFTNGTSVFFTARNDDNGAEPWVSNGTPEGTTLLLDITSSQESMQMLDIDLSAESSDPNEYAFLGDLLIIGGFDFSFFGNSDVPIEPLDELWVFSGTSFESVSVIDLNLATNGSRPERLTDLNGTLFFSARNVENGRELWRSDGTEQGTEVVKDIRPGPEDSSPEILRAIGDILYFAAFDENSFNIWRSDGTEEGTFALGGGVGQANLLIQGDRFGFISLDQQTTFFAAADRDDVAFGTGGGRAIWQTDGTVEGTTLFFNLGDSFNSIRSVVQGNRFFFSGPNPGTNNEALFVSDGTMGGTEFLMEIEGINNPTVLGNAIYFFADGVVNSIALWTSDGTPEGTQMLFDGFDDREGQIAVLGSEMFFFADTDDTGTELWKTDGTESGTVMVADSVPGEDGFDLEDAEDDPEGRMVATNRAVFFIADDRSNGRELWTSDGTEQGTFMLRNIDNSPRGSSINNLVVVDNTVYFEANDRVVGEELWVTRGTTASTKLFRDFLPGPGSSDPDEVLLIGNTLFMQLEDGLTGDELYKFELPDDSLCVAVRALNNNVVTFCL